MALPIRGGYPTGANPESYVRSGSNANAYPAFAGVQLRKKADEPDNMDAMRIAKFGGEFSSQTNNLLIADRQVEMNIRMACGQQWSVWHPKYGKFIDTIDWLSDSERAWRQLPVINKLLRWFVMTHTRLTENPPILTVLPGPDQIDAELAEVVDTLFKKDWRDAEMDAVHDRLMRWVVLSGEGYLLTRLDRTNGQWYPWLANEPLPLVGFDGVPLQDDFGNIRFTPDPVPDVPLGPDGTPNVAMRVDGVIVPIDANPAPHMERTGGIVVDVYSPLQIRGQWGLDIPWHEKRWHAVQRFLTPEEVYETWGVEVTPDLDAQAASNVATIERLLYGIGFYGTNAGRLGSGAWVDAASKGPLCTIYERWEGPIPFTQDLEGTWVEPMMERPDWAGGRHTIWSPNKVIRDGPRAVRWPHVSPIRQFRFVDMLGRPRGMSMIETQLGPQRSFNKNMSILLEASALRGAPPMIVDADAQLLPGGITNEPNKVYTAVKRQGVKAAEYLDPPAVSDDVINSIKFMSDSIDDLGGLRGTEGSAPTDDASGELVKELRFNSDRLLGSVARRNVIEYSRLANDWLALYPVIYTEKAVIQINGEDNLAQTVTCYPMLFQEGHINITPDVESMLPEGRGERQQRAFALWQNGAFGPAQSPQALDMFFSQFRFPAYARMARPGGMDRIMAEQENGLILSGKLVQPVMPWYDHEVHLVRHENYMKGPEFRKQHPMIQQAFIVHRQEHIDALFIVMQQQAAMQPQPDAGGKPGNGAGPTNESSPATGPAQAAPPKSVAAEGGKGPLSPNAT